MTSTDGFANEPVHLIDHVLNVVDARDAQASLIRAIDLASAQNPLGLELTGATAAAPALQLLIGGGRTLSERGAFSGFGPLASGALGALSDDIPVQRQGI